VHLCDGARRIACGKDNTAHFLARALSTALRLFWDAERVDPHSTVGKKNLTSTKLTELVLVLLSKYCFSKFKRNNLIRSLAAIQLIDLRFLVKLAHPGLQCHQHQLRPVSGVDF
jgi:hypothetical protein